MRYMHLFFLLLATALVLGGCGGGGNDLSGQTGLTVSYVYAEDAPDASGGEVRLVTQVRDNVNVRLVGAKITDPEGGEKQVLMEVDTSRVGMGYYLGTYSMKPNADPSRPAEYKMTIEAHDVAGAKDISEPYSFYVPTDWTTTPSGLKMREIRPGIDPAAATGDTVSVHYTGWLDNGTQFDSSRQPGREPFEFTIGANEVIDGWDEGIPGMKTGGMRELEIPPELAYGDQDRGNIPANSTLHFNVEMLTIE